MASGYIRTHLKIRVPQGRKAEPREWDIYELARGGKVIAVRWQQFFQDEFFYGDTPQMVRELSQSVFGVALSPNAVRTIVNNAMQGSADPNKNTFTSGNLMATGFTRGAGNGGEFHLTLTDKTLWPSVQPIDPPRNQLTLSEENELLAEIVTRLNVFSRPAPDCKLGPRGIAIPLDQYMTYEQAMTKIERPGLTYALGAFWSTPFSASPLSVEKHQNGRELCLGFDHRN